MLQPQPPKIQPIHQRHNAQADKRQRRHGPRRAQVRKHDDPDMRERGRKDEARDQERRDRGGGVVGVRVGDVGKHGLVEEGVGEAKDTAGDDGGPEGRLAVGREGEPQ